MGGGERALAALTRRFAALLLAGLIALTVAPPAAAQQRSDFDYWQFDRALVQRGVQAMLMCNGLFTSNRTLEQVFAQELAYLRQPLGTLEGGDYVVDPRLKAVAVGSSKGVPTMRAAWREGVGCVALAPDQAAQSIDSLPRLDLRPPPGDPDTIPWPDGDLLPDTPLPADVDSVALQAAADRAFDRTPPQQVTIGLIVVHRGQIVYERYAPGFDPTTRTRTWSTAKSIAVTLIGMLVDDGRLSLDEPLGSEWLPEAPSPEADPRNAITLRHVLHMSSGLEPVDDRGHEYAIGSGLSYWTGASSVDGARGRALIREPGTVWNYENYDTLLGVLAMKLALGGDEDPAAYLEFPRRALLDRIGMRNTLVGVDRFGDFVLSSQVYTTARDLARFGLLYEQGGTWNGERLLSEAWIEFVRTPAPATREGGGFYGGHWWLPVPGRHSVPADAYSTAGNRGQYVVVVPSRDLVIVRRGLDYGRQGFDQWALTADLLRAFPPTRTD